ncbi:MAG TPA: methyltransferase domain-containing protein [Thermoanaerobaculia bacterium]|nr:methyltransferase domain-containing protein [Thermoanaerobaculia bacterium]
MTVWNDESHASHLAHNTWMANTAVLMHLNERATGDPARDWLSSWAHHWFAGDALRVLVLGCGEGWLERAVSRWPFVARIDAVDLAVEAVARAREAAKDIDKIHYGVADLDRDELPQDTYDVVVAHSVLHHVANLEHAYAQIERAMRPNATLILNEYVGPNRFQYSDDVLAIINTLLACIGQPPKKRPTVEEMIANDPTEAVRSEELLAFTDRHFEVLERKNIGGTILQHLLYETIAGFRFENPRERSILEMLCTIEAMLVDRGVVPCDYVILAARKRDAKVTRANRPLPPRPDAARDVERDPFWGGGGEGRLGRLALLARKEKRANLYRESKVAAFLARFRKAKADDPEIECLLRTAATLAAREAR